MTNKSKAVQWLDILLYLIVGLVVASIVCGVIFLTFKFLLYILFIIGIVIFLVGAIGTGGVIVESIREWMNRRAGK